MVRCPYCAAQLPIHQATCPRCSQPLPGAGPAFIGPTSLAPQPLEPGRVIVAAKEPTHHWIWIGNLITILAGGALSYYFTFRHSMRGLALLGIGLIVLALISLALSRFGTRWKHLSCLVKALIWPGSSWL